MRIRLTLDITRDKDREHRVDEVNDSGRMGFAPTVSSDCELEYEEEDEDDC